MKVMGQRAVYFTILFFLVAGFRFPDRQLPGETIGPDETPLQTQVVVSSLSPDEDYDGLANSVEENGWENAAGLFITNPLNRDSDDDGLTDGQEKLFDTNPLDDTSPGIYVEYSNDLKTSKYFPWDRHGSKSIALDSVVVRRGATFHVGGPSDASIDIAKSSGVLTTLTPQRDVCSGRWAISIPGSGTVGKYTITLERGAWSESLNLYVIFELPTNMSQADVAAFVYSDDPDNFRDEYAIFFLTTNDLKYSWPSWPPYHNSMGRGVAFQTDQYEPYVFEEHVMNAINGYTGQRGAVTALGHELDGLLRFEASSIRYDMWTTLHKANQQAQCSTHASAMTSFARGAGIPARPVIVDWDMFVVGSVLFDHSTEVWLGGEWDVMRAYRGSEELPPDPIDSGILPPTDRTSWRYRDSMGDIIVVADSNWVWEQMLTEWWGEGQMDYLFGNYNNREIVRWDWVDTEVTKYNGWGWGREPADVGDPYETWLAWGDSPTPSIIVSVEGSGSVTKDPDQPSYEYADVVTLEAFPDPGWSFAGWSGDLGGSDNPRSIRILRDEDYLITANLTQNGYVLTLNTSGSGSVTRDPDQPTYNYGDGVTLEAVPDPDWSFAGWSGDLSGADNPTTITINDNTSVTATFVEDGGGALAVADVPSAGALSVTTAQASSVQIGPVVADYGVDLDGNGRFDQLVIEFEVSVAQPGYYSIGGFIDSPEFTSYAKIAALDSAATYTYLEAGPQTVRLAFDGLSISLSRVDGPYQVKELWVSNLSLDSDLVDLAMNTLDRKYPGYVTAAYKASDFDTLGAVFTDWYSELGEDSDRDGLYESLTLDVGLEISVPGTYTVVGDLYDGRGELISEATWTGSGSPALLHFDDIRGADGPYTLRNLYLLNVDEEIIDSRVQAYTTQQVTAAEIKTHFVDKADSGEIGAEAILPGLYTDAGVDTDGDGQYDKLVITTELVIEPGEGGQAYRIEGWLVDENDSLIAWAISDPKVLAEGTHSLTLDFDGRMINVHGVDGPYKLVALKALPGDTYAVLDEVDVAHLTQAYNYDEFEDPSIESGGVRIFEDNMENGTSWWTTTGTVWGLDDSVWYSPDHAWEADASGSESGSLRTVTLDLSRHVEPALRFRTCYAMQSSADKGHVEVSTGGGNWTRLSTFINSTSHWTTEFVDLSDFASASTLQVRFRAVSESGLEWYVDDVYLSGLADDDGDGISSIDEDLNGDGDPSNDDSDGDGVPNYLEPNNEDTDGDGIKDHRDPDDDGDGAPTADEGAGDADNDGLPNYLDPDDDNDGIPSADEDVNGDGNPSNDDTDNDGLPNHLDPDDDGDSIPTAGEDINGDGNLSNDDSDGDGLPNYLDADDDGDGVPTADEDVEQVNGDPRDDDSDDDGTPDYLDTDDDNDGVPSADEDLNGDGNPANDDSDGGGAPNYLDPDDDEDGILTKDEGPPNDQDGDHVPDYLEPNNQDTDQDGTKDHRDPDDDGDGVPTAEEDWNHDGSPINDDGNHNGIPDYLDPNISEAPTRYIYFPLVFKK